MTTDHDERQRPRWILLTKYGTSDRVGMRTWGTVANDDEKTRVDLYENDNGHWTAHAVVGDAYWRPMEYLDLWTALRAGDRWIREMKEHGYDCEGAAPQLRPLNVEFFTPANEGFPDCYESEDK